jgi:hypothetical protein
MSQVLMTPSYLVSKIARSRVLWASATAAKEVARSWGSATHMHACAWGQNHIDAMYKDRGLTAQAELIAELIPRSVTHAIAFWIQVAALCTLLYCWSLQVRQFDDVIVSMMGLTGWLAVIYFFR